MVDRTAGIRHRLERLVWPLAGLALLLVALGPLLAGTLPWRGDGSLHFYRLAELELAAESGDWFPRWSPDLGYGFGFPLFHYYAPLSYQLLLPLRFLGLSTGTAFMVGYGAALAALALGLAGWSSSSNGPNRAQALVPLIAAGYAPYLLFNVYYRGAYAEVWGAAWFSLSLWAVARAAATGRRAAMAAVALTVAGLILSHNATALIGLPLLAGYGLLEATIAAEAPEVTRRRRVGAVVAGLLLGLALSAFFWLPALVDRDLIVLDRLVDGANFDFRAHFLGLADLLALPPRIDPLQVNPTLPLSLSWPALVAAVVAWLPAGRPLTARLRRARLWFSLALVGLVILILPVSEPLWEAVPLLSFVQFPWRLLGPASLCLAALAGLGVSRLGQWAVPTFAVLAVGWGLAWLSPPVYPVPADPTPADLIRFEAETGFLGTTSAGDFLPATVQSLPDARRLLPAYEAMSPSPFIPRLAQGELPSGVQIVDQVESWNETRLRLVSAGEATLTFRRYAFPGWLLAVDGKPWPWSASQPDGLIRAQVPAGEHYVRLAFGATAQWRSAGTLSALAGIVLLALALWPERPRLTSRRKRTAPARPGLWLLALGTFLFVVKAGVLDRVSHPLRPERFDGARVAGSETAFDADFGGVLRLVGADLPGTPGPADEPLALTLYWTASGQATQELSVSVHLIDGKGRRAGQSDAQHPAGYPVTRWEPGEYAIDRHRLLPLPGTPPGEYALWLYVYEAGSGRLVDQLDASGRPAGVRFLLGNVSLTRPIARPAADQLTASSTQRTDLGDGIALLRAGALPEAATVGEPVSLELYWLADETPSQATTARFQLIDAVGIMAVEWLWEPAGPSWPPSSWEAGDAWRDVVLLPVPPTDRSGAPLLAGRYDLEAALLNDEQRAIEPGRKLGQIDIITPNRLLAPPLQRTLNVTLGGVAALYGHALSATELPSGASIDVTLVWESLAVTEKSYTVFVQLLRDGRILAQQDAPPGGGTRPTTGWLPGEYVVDRATLAVPAGTPAGLVELVVGIYDAGTGERLRTPDGRDAIILPDAVSVVDVDS